MSGKSMDSGKVYIRLNLAIDFLYYRLYIFFTGKLKPSKYGLNAISNRASLLSFTFPN